MPPIARDISSKMSTFTVLSRRAIYDPQQRSYGISLVDDDPSLGDRRSYFCMLDRQSRECGAQ